MICPNCDGPIRAKDFDKEYEWYECPNCEGCITADEIIKDEIKKPVPVAKGKKRLTEIAADEEAIAEFEKKQTVVVKSDKSTKHRDEVPFDQVVSVWADELQAVYGELGGSLNELNARDKALILFREVHLKDGVTAREKEMNLKLCAAHGS